MYSMHEKKCIVQVMDGLCKQNNAKKKKSCVVQVTGGLWHAPRHTIFFWSVELLSALGHMHSHGVVLCFFFVSAFA